MGKIQLFRRSVDGLYTLIGNSDDQCWPMKIHESLTDWLTGDLCSLTNWLTV